MQGLSIAENEDTFFVGIDKKKIEPAKIEMIIKFLTSITNEN